MDRTRPGAGTFTIEGRSAPALFVVGWLATLLGLGILAIGLLSGGGGAARLVALVGLGLLSIGLVAGAGSQGIERRARGVLAYRGPSPILVFAASIPISLLAIVLLAVPFEWLGLMVDSPLGRLVSVAAQALIYIGLVRLLVVDAGALSWAEMGVRRLDRRAVRDLLAGAVWAAPVILATLPLAAVLGALLPVVPESPLPATGELTGLVIQLVAGAVVAPVGEEVLFRGFATTAWARGLGKRRGLIRAALFFALVHVLTISGDSAAQAASLAVVGFATRVPVALTLGWLF
ncbi:MAG: CPBP family intramembrane metalloprotease, partial [Chloroflexi bacterium]|nr:CPBP family intramembrane metalloprotease [Chloroflexota bacterium]